MASRLPGHSRRHTVVYLGPSLPLREARRILDADFRPPVRRGDLPQLSRVDTVVIIDGDFWQSLSVSPKEILAVIDHGVRVIGASSMGALRAAELASFGMEGCGWVFDQYRSGKVVGDDEVALMYSPVTWEPLTIPLINVRFWLEQLCAARCLERARASALLRRARRIFFAERTPERLYDAFRATEGEARVRAWLLATGGSIPDVKAHDARLALGWAACPPGATTRTTPREAQPWHASEWPRGDNASPASDRPQAQRQGGQRPRRSAPHSRSSSVGR